MKKKYTIEEFKKMYCEAAIKAINELDKQYKDSMIENGKDTTTGFFFTMQNMMVTSEIEKILFKENENE